MEQHQDNDDDDTSKDLKSKIQALYSDAFKLVECQKGTNQLSSC